MTWVRLDDGFFSNVKVVSISKDARLLYLAALCYAGGQGTDGKIPAAALKLIAAQADVDDCRAATTELCHVSLWDNDDGDLSIHDFLKYNPTKADMEGMREARAKAGRKGAAATNSRQVPQQTTRQVPQQMVDTLRNEYVNEDGDRDETKTDERTEKTAASAARRRSRKPLTDEQRATLHGRYAGAIDVEGAIAYALSTKYADKWTDEFLALDRWLKGDWEKATNRKFARNGSGNNLAGAGHGGNAKAAWSAALGRDIGHGIGLLVEGDE